MAKPVITFGDPEEAAIDYLVEVGYIGALAERKPTTIQAYPPAKALTGSDTWLQVQSDGSPRVVTSWGQGAVLESATVRCTVHAAQSSKRSELSRAVSLARGLLLAHPGDARVQSVLPLIGRSQIITDPTTKNLMVWFTVRVNLRPIAVSA